MNEHNTATAGASARRRETAWFLVGLLGLALVVFRHVLSPDVVLLTTDGNIGITQAGKASLPQALWAGWNDNLLVGIPQSASLTWFTPFQMLVSSRVYTTWIYAVNMILGSLFLFFFLRERGCGWPAAALGALTALWVGSNFTLIFAGHQGKFSLLMFACLYLWMVERAVRTGRLPYTILAGGAMGSMFLEQQDLAFFFAVPLGLYAVYLVVRRHGWSFPHLARRIIPIVVVAFCLACRVLLSGYGQAVKGVAVMETDDPQQKWEYATQWSWPPGESIDFIAPGFTGWRSNEPEGPYWGRMGRTPGWDQNGQGFRNFKLENQYIGILPIAFALLAVWIACFRKQQPGRLRSEVVFWGVLCLVALLLSFGKFFPLYRLLYMLPIVSSIRNPNKFLQLFQLALAILAAFGLEYTVGRYRNVADGVPRKRIKQFVIALTVLGGFMLLWAFGGVAGFATHVARFQSLGWGDAAPGIVSNRNQALFHGAVLAFLSAGFLAYAFKSGGLGEKAKNGAIIALLVVVTGDLLYLSRYYVRAVSMDIVEENPAIRFLKDNQKQQRVALVSQAGFYNHWLTYSFPYHDLEAINVTQLPRMPSDYKAFLGAVSSHPVLFWQLCAVGYLMGPAEAWTQISQNPELKDSFELRYAFNVYADGDLVRVTPATEEQPGRHVIIKNNGPAARYALYGGWEVVEDDVLLERLRNPQPGAFRSVYVSPDTAGDLPASSDQPIQGSIDLEYYRAGKVILQVTTDRPAILRLADRYTPDWNAIVDEHQARVLRCDYLFQGVWIQPGLHQVVVEFSPDVKGLWVQVAAMALCLLAVVVVAARRDRKTAGGDVID